MTRLSNERTEIKILTPASVADLTDSQGNFKAISVRYKVGDVFTGMVIPIAKVSLDKIGLEKQKGKGNLYYMVEACEMKCTSVDCNVCKHEIIERCAIDNEHERGS